MPDVSANIATIRGNQHQQFAWLAVFGTDVLAQANIDGITGDPVTSLTVVFTSGAYTDIYRNCEAEIFTAGGVSKGRVRVRSTGTLDSTTIPVAEVSDATVNITTSDTIKFYNDFRLRPKLPAANATFDPDLTPYSIQNTLLKPIVVSGGPVPAWVDDGQTYATIDFNASRSFNTDPDSGSTKTYAWVFPTGSTPTSSTSATPSVQIPVGDHTVVLTVTDSSNSATQTQYIPVRVFNAANPPIPIVIDSMDGDEQLGWSVSFTPLQPVSLSDAPDGTRIAIFVDEYYGATNASYGNIDVNRSYIKFCGWLRRDTSTTDSNVQRQQFECVSNLERLGEINGFSQVFVDDPSLTGWPYIPDLTLNIAIYQILRWYTTALELLDIVVSNTDFNYPRFYITANTPLLQVRELADATDCRMVCSRNGELAMLKRLELNSLASRGAETTVLTLTAQDILELQIEREHWRPVGLLEVRGITETGSAFFSRYPGSAFGDGPQNIVQDRIITTGQSDLNTRAGMRGAELDRTFTNASGELRHAPFVRLTLRGAYDVFDFYRQWVGLNIAGSYNGRGINLAAFRYLLKRTTITHENGTSIVRIELQAETAGSASDTYIPPAEESTQLPPYEPNPIPPYTPPPPPDNIDLYPEGGANVAAIHGDGRISVTSDFDTLDADGGPTWNTNDHSASISGTVIAWTLDASTLTGGWVITTTNIYYIDDVFSATPTITNQHTFTTTTSNRNMDADYTFNIGQDLVVVSAYGSPLRGFYYMVSTDGGAIWSSEAVIGMAWTLRAPSGQAGLHVSTAEPDTAYVFGNEGSGADGIVSLYRLQMSTQTFTELDIELALTKHGAGLHIPFGDADDRLAFYGPTLSRGDTLTGVAIEVDSVPGQTSDIIIDDSLAKFLISSATNNTNALMVMSSGQNAFYTSNMYATPIAWSKITPVSIYRQCQLIRNGTKAYLWGIGGRVAYWDGVTVDVRNTAHSGSVIGLVVNT